MIIIESGPDDEWVIVFLLIMIMLVMVVAVVVAAQSLGVVMNRSLRDMRQNDYVGPHLHSVVARPRARHAKKSKAVRKYAKELGLQLVAGWAGVAVGVLGTLLFLVVR